MVVRRVGSLSNISCEFECGGTWITTAFLRAYQVYLPAMVAMFVMATMTAMMASVAVPARMRVVERTASMTEPGEGRL
jgi:hypothetical protein